MTLTRYLMALLVKDKNYLRINPPGNGHHHVSVGDCFQKGKRIIGIVLG